MESVQRPVSIEEIATKAMGASRPVIGIVPTYDLNEGILRMNNHYAQAVVAAGGAPLIVPFTSDVSVYESLLPRIDGFVLSGGQDISPVRYGGDITYGKLSELTPEREEVEYLGLCAAGAMHHAVDGWAHLLKDAGNDGGVGTGGTENKPAGVEG